MQHLEKQQLQGNFLHSFRLVAAKGKNVLRLFFFYICCLARKFYKDHMIENVIQLLLIPRYAMCLSSCDHGFLLPVCRVVRVIRQPRGNMLLIGVGGSGRQSLSRLASYIISYNVFQIEVTRHYRLQEFREGGDIKVP